MNKFKQPSFTFWKYNHDKIVGRSEIAHTVFILGCGIAEIPHFCKKSPKLSDTVWNKSPTLNRVAIHRNIQNKTNFSYSRTLRVSKNTHTGKSTF